MSQYEGLNLPALLQLMHGLVFPAPVSWLPQTPGWWVVLAWLLAVLFLCIRHWLISRRRNRYRRDALAELKAIKADAEPGAADTAQRIAALLKRTALAAYPRRDVASLYGRDWAIFLTRSANDDIVIANAADLLAAAAYQPGIDGKDLLQPARRWIRLHHA